MGGVRVLVGMVLLAEFAVGLLDLPVRGLLVDVEEFVVVVGAKD